MFNVVIWYNCTLSLSPTLKIIPSNSYWFHKALWPQQKQNTLEWNWVLPIFLICPLMDGVWKVSSPWCPHTAAFQVTMTSSPSLINQWHQFIKPVIKENLVSPGYCPFKIQVQITLSEEYWTLSAAWMISFHINTLENCIQYDICHSENTTRRGRAARRMMTMPQETHLVVKGFGILICCWEGQSQMQSWAAAPAWREQCQRWGVSTSQGKNGSWPKAAATH